MIINGKQLAQFVHTQTKEMLEKTAYPRKPKLVIFLLGENPDSLRYIRQKQKNCERLGIICQLNHLSEQYRLDLLLQDIAKANADPSVDGIIMQQPFPAAFYTENQTDHSIDRMIIDAISPEKDVDGLTTVNIGKYTINDHSGFLPATAQGVLYAIESTGIAIDGKRAVVIGRSLIVGKPVSMLLLEKGAAVTILHSHISMHDIEDMTKQADILVAAVGKPGFVKDTMVKKDAIVIDVGISVSGQGKLSGDVDFDAVEKKVGYITPVPGGIGPLTVAYIIQNVVNAYLSHNATASDRIS